MSKKISNKIKRWIEAPKSTQPMTTHQDLAHKLLKLKQHLKEHIFPLNEVIEY